MSSMGAVPLVDGILSMDRNAYADASFPSKVAQLQ
jgi:hypothetical protein